VAVKILETKAVITVEDKTKQTLAEIAQKLKQLVH
jgi:hypothetical protein